MGVLRRDVSAQGGVQSVFHDLQTTSVVVQIRDQAGKIVSAGSAGVSVTSQNSIEVDFPEQFVGQTYALFIAY